MTIKNLEEFRSLENAKNPHGLIFLQEVGFVSSHDARARVG